MGKELVEKKGGELAVQADDWCHQSIDASDILIPKLLLAQPTSQLGDDVVPGQIVRSTDRVVLGEDVQVIPLSTTKSWTVFDTSGRVPKFKRIEPWTSTNCEAPWTFEEDGVPMRRDQTLNFYCLIPADIQKEREALEGDGMPDPDDALLPVALSFSRTSFKSGRQLVSHFAKCEMFKLPPAVSTFNLAREKVSGDSGVYYIWTVAKHGKTDPADVEVAHKWWGMMGKSKVVVDHADLEEDEVITPEVVAQKQATPYEEGIPDPRF